jgi:hypothetical protein
MEVTSMLTGRFITTTELTGPFLLTLLNDILVEYPTLPSYRTVSEELEGYDMLEIVTLRSNLSALERAMVDLPYGMKFTFSPEEQSRIRIVIDTFQYYIMHNLERFNTFSMEA